MDWSVLASTALGGLLAAGGGFVGQWWSERRAVEREERSVGQEQRTWSREQRRGAYLEFVNAFRSVREQSERQFSDRSLPPISLDRLDEAGLAVEIFGSRAAVAAAKDARRALLFWGSLAVQPVEERVRLQRVANGTRTREHVTEQLEKFQAQARSDLGGTE